MDCVICRGAKSDPELCRVQVWQDDLWRLSVSIASPAPGFSYLEPKRHIPHVEDLNGDEAATFGTVLAHCSRILKDETDAERVYVFVFGGGIPHLHVHLAPHREGDAWNDRLIRGTVREKRLPSGARSYVSEEFPDLPTDQLQEVAERVRRRLKEDPPPKLTPPPLLLYPVPRSRPYNPDDPEIPPLRPEPPDDPWPDRPAHDPWYG